MHRAWRTIGAACLSGVLLFPCAVNAQIHSLHHTPQEWTLAWGRHSDAPAGQPAGLRDVRVTSAPGVQAASGRNRTGDFEIWVRSFPIHADGDIRRIRAQLAS